MAEHKKSHPNPPLYPTGNRAGAGGVTSWDSIMGRPDTFPPEDHTHPFSDMEDTIADGQVPESAVTQHEAALEIDWDQITDAPSMLSDPTTDEGDLIVRGSSGLEALPVGDEDDVLTIVSGVPAWAPAAGGGGSIALDDLSDVDASSPSDGDVLTYDDDDDTWKPAAPTISTPARDASVVTTSSLADETTETGTVDISALSGALLIISADVGCWVRLYSTAAARTSDSSRDIDVDPDPGSGCLADFLFTAGAANSPIHVSPVCILYNGDGTPSSDIYYSIQNREGSTTAVTVTLTVLPMES